MEISVGSVSDAVEVILTAVIGIAVVAACILAFRGCEGKVETDRAAAYADCVKSSHDSAGCRAAIIGERGE